MNTLQAQVRWHLMFLKHFCCQVEGVFLSPRWVILVYFMLIWGLLCFPSVALLPLLRFTWQGFHLQRNCSRKRSLWSSQAYFLIIIYSFFTAAISAVSEIKYTKEIIETGFQKRTGLFLLAYKVYEVYFVSVLEVKHKDLKRCINAHSPNYCVVLHASWFYFIVYVTEMRDF